GTEDGILLEDLRDESDNVVEAFEDRVLGRIALRDVCDERTGEVLVRANEEINEKVVERFRERGIKSAWVRSVLTCKTRYGVCVKCYGRNLATGRLVDIGEAVGIVAAQSIGEPGTQLTMRTFHTGGIRIAGEDITQGLPRVEQLFEVRKPKKAAVLSEVDGTVEKIETIGNRRKIYVRPSEDEPDQTIRTYFVPHDVRTCVVEGDTVKAGERLTLGPINPRDILKIKGIRAVQKYLLEEIQSVYVSQGVNINDKHIEVIIRQIARLNKIMVEDAGNTSLLSGEMVFLEDFEEENDRILKENQSLLENSRALLEGQRLYEDVLDISGELLLRKGEVLEEPTIQQILSIECKPFVIEREGNIVRVLRGYRNLEHELLDRICVEEVRDREGKLLVKAGETLRPVLLDHIAEVGPVSLRVREKTTWEKLKGSILAEEVIDRETKKVVIPANTRLENEEIELLQEHNVEQVVVWKNVRPFPVKENLVKVLRDEILGKEVAKDIVSPQTGEVIIQSGQPISRGLARRLVSEGIREIPLRDGRFFSIEGRLIEMLEQEIVGKVAAQDVVLGENGTVLVRAGEIIDREDVAKIAEDNVSLLFLREPESEKETRTLVEEVIYLPGLKHVATGRPIVLGITKASLAVESFLSAASFQQTTHVLADSAIKGKVDELIGLKENVIIGKVIPSGTGCSQYRKIRLSTEEEVAAQQVSGAKEEALIRDLMGVRDFSSLIDEDEEFEEGFDIISIEDETEEQDLNYEEDEYEDEEE
ncbi:MAG: DNA-directed RNA polymerase subunit beta', partial [Candidatus Caldatribacteriaceae bacterium]